MGARFPIFDQWAELDSSRFNQYQKEPLPAVQSLFDPNFTPKDEENKNRKTGRDGENDLYWRYHPRLFAV